MIDVFRQSWFFKLYYEEGLTKYYIAVWGLVSLEWRSMRELEGCLKRVPHGAANGNIVLLRIRGGRSAVVAVQDVEPDVEVMKHLPGELEVELCPETWSVSDVREGIQPHRQGPLGMIVGIAGKINPHQCCCAIVHLVRSFDIFTNVDDTDGNDEVLAELSNEGPTRTATEIRPQIVSLIRVRLQGYKPEYADLMLQKSGVAKTQRVLARRVSTLLCVEDRVPI